jgi:PAS domain S-box-containing protein
MDALQSIAGDEIKRMLRVLLVEDSAEDAELIERELAKAGRQLTVVRVVTASAMQQELAAREWDVIITDFNVPGFGALPALKQLQQSGLDIPFIILSGIISDEVAVAAMRAGTHDYLRKDKLSRLLPAIEREMQEAATRRKNRQMESDLRQNEQRLRATFNHAAIGIVEINSQGRLVTVNDRICQILGYRREELLLMSVEDLAAPEDRAHTLHIHNQINHGRAETLAYEKCYLKRDGAPLWVRATVSGVHDAERSVLYSIATIEDIMDRKHLDEARSRLAAIVEFCEDAIIGKDLDGIVTSWNKGAERTFGHSAQEMIGESLLRLLPADRIQEEVQALDRIRNGETVGHIESIRRRKDGKLIHVSLLISPILGANNRIVGAAVIARDITETKLLERQLHQSHKMEAIGQLTGGIAHDFNNLLRIVVGNLDLLGRLTQSNSEADKRVKTAQKAAARGADLTRRLLALSSSEKLNPAPFALDEAIKNVIEMETRTLGPEITIRTHFDPCVSMVFADVSGLETALLNLAVNARDAMPKGGILTIGIDRKTLEASFTPVTAGEIKSGSYVCISVTDTGCGMSAETLERAFEPFYTTKPRGKGTGLGLAMVYGFAKQSGGTVRLYSEEGIGTTVSLYLPLAEEPLQPTRVSLDLEE